MIAFLRTLTSPRILPRHITTRISRPSLPFTLRILPTASQPARFSQNASAQPSVQPQPTSHSTSPYPPHHPNLIDATVKQAAKWALPPTGLASSLSADPKAVQFFMAFVDRVMRPDHPPTAARMLTHLNQTLPIPNILTPIDNFLLSLGSTFAAYLPNVVIPFARLRMLSFVSTFISSLQSLRFDGQLGRNINLLGEAVLGEKEAKHRLDEAIRLLRTPGVDYVSVKVSGVVSQLNPWDFEGSLERVLHALRKLFREAAASNPNVLINLDMEEYRDLELTIAAFTTVLSEPEFQDLDAGIVLQTYLPDALPALQQLVSWAHTRPGNGEIKIRLVKGANLAMEKVDAAIHGWNQATYQEKADTDANYLRCLSWALTPENTQRVRIGVASHNLFLLAYAHLLAERRGVSHRVGFEMLQGMTPAHTPLLAEQGHGMLLYTPVCAPKDFDVAISYLFRRFEETTAEGNFLRSMADMTPDSPAFKLEEARFREAVERLDRVSTGPNRMQLRPAPGCEMTAKMREGMEIFVNEPDTDPALADNRRWGSSLFDSSKFTPVSPARKISSLDEMGDVVQKARNSIQQWREGRSTAEREALFMSVADELARRRGDLINAMIFEGHKTIAEADPEVSEAIDFATYYGSQGKALPDGFKEHGVVTVTSPWNFPVAIPCGGVLAALAAGNAVILKPSSNTPRCAEIMAECLWAAGVPEDVFQFVQCAGRDIGKKLVTESDGIILTGSSETAAMFRSWKKDMRLFAETSGKNSLIITQAADIDLAVADLVQSSFSNAGQRCSASSLAICVGDVYNSDRFVRQLEDAAKTLKVGPATDVSTVMGPLIQKPDPKLYRALTELDEGEEWLAEPRCLDADGEGQTWTPGVRLGVKPNSWFHQTEVFGPVLGVMQAKDLDEALALQNGTSFGLTGGIHSLDPMEIEKWTENVEVGNAYINRAITGAIVQRQSFGGWKGSVVGPGAKAGGPNYVLQFGTVEAPEASRDESWLKKALESDEKAWQEHFSKEHDLSGLFCEENVLRYRALPEIAVRVAGSANPAVIKRVRGALERSGVSNVLWSENESAQEFVDKLKKSNAPRVRVLGEVEPEILDYAIDANVHVASDPVVCDGRYEMLHYLREQSISKTLHRFGNMVGASEGSSSA